MLTPAKTYRNVYNSFQWQIPEFYNIGIDICDKWARQRYRLALIYEDEKGYVEKYTFWDLKNLSNKLAHGLKAFGLGSGDRLGILLPQCPQTAISHIACYKVGAVAIPLFTLFGTDHGHDIAAIHRFSRLLQPFEQRARFHICAQ